MSLQQTHTDGQIHSLSYGIWGSAMSRYPLLSDRSVSAVTVETRRDDMAAPLSRNLDIKARRVARFKLTFCCVTVSGANVWSCRSRLPLDITEQEFNITQPSENNTGHWPPALYPCPTFSFIYIAALTVKRQTRTSGKMYAIAGAEACVQGNNIKCQHCEVSLR